MIPPFSSKKGPVGHGRHSCRLLSRSSLGVDAMHCIARSWDSRVTNDNATMQHQVHSNKSCPSSLLGNFEARITYSYVISRKVRTGKIKTNNCCLLMNLVLKKFDVTLYNIKLFLRLNSKQTTDVCFASSYFST